MDDSLKKKIGQRIKAARLAAGLSQPALAEKAGLGSGKMTLIRYERGDGILIDTVTAIENALGLKPGAILHGDTTPDIVAIDYEMMRMAAEAVEMIIRQKNLRITRPEALEVTVEVYNYAARLSADGQKINPSIPIAEIVMEKHIVNHG